MKLQPNRQTSVAVRKNLKLSFKYYGPYEVPERIEAVAYRLKLPAGATIHPVFHVYYLKKKIGLTVTVSTNLPVTDGAGVIKVSQ